MDYFFLLDFPSLFLFFDLFTWDVSVTICSVGAPLNFEHFKQIRLLQVSKQEKKNTAIPRLIT